MKNLFILGSFWIKFDTGIVLRQATFELNWIKNVEMRAKLVQGIYTKRLECE